MGKSRKRGQFIKEVSWRPLSGGKVKRTFPTDVIDKLDKDACKFGLNRTTFLYCLLVLRVQDETGDFEFYKSLPIVFGRRGRKICRALETRITVKYRHIGTWEDGTPRFEAFTALGMPQTTH